MKILVTGSGGFIGKNLIETLKNIRDGSLKNSGIQIDEIFEFDKNNSLAELQKFTQECDFVFNLAGVNRPKDNHDFLSGNFGFASILLNALKLHNNNCPVMMSSSVQAALTGRFGNSEYGRSKLAGEELFFSYAKDTNSRVLVYRFPNVFGKWCKPNYNSAVATFCNAVANDLPFYISDPTIELELLYIDDLINEMLCAIKGYEHRCYYPVEGECIDNIIYDGLTPIGSDDGEYCYVPVTHRASLGEIAELLNGFNKQRETLMFSSFPMDSFEKKLYSMYLSYLPVEKMTFTLSGSKDERGSFTEFFKNESIGQFSINISKPGKMKGQHWHHTKMEVFVVIKGHALIQERQIGIDPETGERYTVREFEVYGDDLQCVYMLPGYTHNILNLSDSEDLITVIWANEIFSKDKPDTFFEVV